MATKYIVDTHALIWYLEGKSTLGSKARAALESTESELVLPVIALAEAVFIVEKGRTGITSVQDTRRCVRRSANRDIRSHRGNS